MRMKILPEYPNYRICDDGNIYLISRARKVKASLNDNGYLRFRVRGIDGKFHNMYVHRLVALAFVPQEEGKPLIDHINGNPLDNRAENLRWCTILENFNFPIAKQRAKAWSESQAAKDQAIRLGLLRRKPVVSLTEKIKFNGLVQAAAALGVNDVSTIVASIAGGYKVRGHLMAYFDAAQHAGYKEFAEADSTMLAGIKGKGMPVLCITDGAMFPRAKDAAEYYHTSLNNIARCARGERHSTCGKQFKYITWTEYNDKVQEQGE